MKQAILIFLTAVLSACASAADLGEQSIRTGVITRIESVEIERDHQIGTGAVLGAAAGGIIGHQIGHGGAGTVIGALGGGLAGNAIQNQVEHRPGQQIFVQLDNGVSVVITQPADAGLRPGDRVLIEGDGKSARVVRA
ncbi:MAG TPA: glycine zipper domain-containing protein [Burkholderiales bacterium]|nr:glycine zipper domain-containing protein [Burkholderiales bacterium]